MNNIITNSSLHVLSVLKNPYLIIEIAEMTGLNRKTVSSTIHELAKYGIVLQKENKYYFSKRHPLIRNFVKDYWRYRTNKNLKAISDQSILIWQRGPEFLFRIDADLDDRNKMVSKRSIHPTAIGVFYKYDLKVMSDTRYYFHGKRKLKVEDHIIHTILIEPNSSIYNSYALALYSKTCPPELLKFGRYYDIKDHIITLLEYLELQKKNSDLVLPWNEYNDLIMDMQ